GCFTISLRVKRETQPRGKLAVAILYTCLAGESRIAGVEKSDRSLCENGAANSLIKAIPTEIEHGAVREALRQKRFPSDATIECQTGRDFPAILCIKRVIPLVSKCRVRRTLR